MRLLNCSMYFKPSLLFVFFSFLLISCQDNKSATDTTSNIPSLLSRYEKLRMGKEWDDVMNNYQKLKLAIGKNDADHESRIRLAQLFIREARITGEHGHYYNAALTMTDQVLQSKTTTKDDEFLALMTKAGVQLSHHDFSKALVTGKKAIALNPNNPQIYGVLVDANVELGNYEEAIKMADIMISMKPDLRSYARISYIREIHGQVEDAFEAMKMAVEAGVPGYEDTSWAMLTMAEMYQLYGKADKAELLYKEILAQRPDYPFAIAGLGSLYMEKGDYPNAEKWTNDAISIIPEVGFYIQLAEMYKKQERADEFDGVIKDIKQMLADDEKSGHNMNLEYANVYLELLDQPEQALSYVEKEYQKRPKNIDVNRLLAKIHKATKNEFEGKKYLEVAMSTKSKHPDLQKLLPSI